MWAVTIKGGELEWDEHPSPEPGSQELLVRVEAAGINGADIIQRAGHYPAPQGSPQDIPGLELAGEVVGRGPDVTRFTVGDRIMAVVGGGGQGELATVHERLAVPVPDGVPWPEAGGFPEVFTTAHDALFTQCGLGMGERLLVTGAAGGVGTAAVQLGVAAGATVTGTARHDSQRQELARFGDRVRAVAPDATAGLGPFDVVLELIGAPNIPGDLEALAPGGRLTVIGTSAGANAQVDLRIVMGKRARIHGSTLRARSLEDKAAAARAIERHVLPLLANGSIRVPVAATYPMAQAPAAYEHFTKGGKFGKVVLLAT